MTHHEMRAPCVTRFNETVTRQTVTRLTTFVVPSLVRPSYRRRLLLLLPHFLSCQRRVIISPQSASCLPAFQAYTLWFAVRQAKFVCDVYTVHTLCSGRVYTAYRRHSIDTI